MHRLDCVPLAVASLVAALTTAPAHAQARPELSDFSAARLRVPVLSVDPVRVRVAAWQQGQVQAMDADDEGRPATFVERLGFAAIFTAVGAGLGYSWWHTCNDPESDVIWSCIVAPRRLGTSVRFGAYSGLAVGLSAFVGDLRVVKQSGLLRADGSNLLIDHHASGGWRVGVNFRF